MRADQLLMLIELGEVSALAGAPSVDQELTDAVRLAENIRRDRRRAGLACDVHRGYRTRDLDIARERLRHSLAVQQQHGIPHVEAHTDASTPATPVCHHLLHHVDQSGLTRAFLRSADGVVDGVGAAFDEDGVVPGAV